MRRHRPTWTGQGASHGAVRHIKSADEPTALDRFMHQPNWRRERQLMAVTRNVLATIPRPIDTQTLATQLWENCRCEVAYAARFLMGIAPAMEEAERDHDRAKDQGQTVPWRWHPTGSAFSRCADPEEVLERDQPDDLSDIL